MMKSLKNTTALLLCASLTAPAPLLAQGNGQGRAANMELCGDVLDPPCLTEEGNLVTKGKGNGLELCAEDVAELEMPCRLEADGESYVLVEAGSDEAIEAEAEAMAEAADEPVESEVAEGAEAAESETEVEAGAEADAGGAVESDPVESADAAGGDEAADAAEVEMTDAPEAETEMEAEAEVEMEAEAETEMEAEAEAEVEMEAATDGTGSATESGGEGEAAVAESGPAVNEAGEIEVEEAPAAAAAAAATDGEASAEAEVETEEVTEETSRSATEDFETSVSGESASASASSGGGMSNFEKALLLGIGAVAVGSILDNGSEVVSNSGDRVVIQTSNGELRVLKDDDALLRQPGSQVRTETFADGSTRTTVTREDGTKIVTIRAADGRVVRRARVFQDGSQIVLFDDTETAEPVDVSDLPNVEVRTIDLETMDEDELRLALQQAEARELDRRFSLRQIRQIREVRELAPQIELNAITFATGSAAIQPSQAEELAALGRAMSRIIEERPGEVFLIEGHTDTVGNASYNLALSDRRAETVALALTEYYDVPPENMITQGYGESQLKIRQEGDIRENRRAVVRRITPLLRTASLN